VFRLVKFLVKFLAALALLCIALPASAFADDWLVSKLRGEALQLVGNDWTPLQRGDVIPDDRVIRTLGGTRAMLQRGKETIEVAANTQIRIIDKAGDKPFTTVQQFFGTVAVEAEVQNVQHFAVQTPYLAAVVKGTHFEVKTTSRQSVVKVQRGHVAVEDLHTGAHTLLGVGQSASVGKDGSFTVSGKGTKPAILNSAGEVLNPAAAAKGNLTIAVGKSVNVTAGKGGVNAGVTTGVVNGNVGVGTGGVEVGADVGGGAVGVEASVDSGGVDVGANVGGTSVGVSVGGGSSGGDGGGSTVSVTVGGLHIGL
jgi:hypothetical protein